MTPPSLYPHSVPVLPNPAAGELRVGQLAPLRERNLRLRVSKDPIWLPDRFSFTASLRVTVCTAEGCVCLSV